MKRVALAGLIIVLVLTLVWFIRMQREKYTREQYSNIWSYFSDRYRGTNLDNVRKYTVKSILGVDIGNDPTVGLSNINLLVDTFNSNGFTFTHFSNISELNSMFETAYNSGESGLGNRDRMILRAFAATGEVTTMFPPNSVPLTYTSDGVPDFTSTIVSESGKTTKEMLQYCFTLIDKLFSSGNGQNPYTPDVIDYINSTIPSQYTQKFDRTDNMSVVNAIQSPSPNDTTIWFMKALVIGPAYLAWLAENKWKLELTWTP